MGKYKKLLSDVFSSGRKKNKIFCIGRNKTGTTSLKKALQDLGYQVGDQSRAELLVKDYDAGNWSPIIKYCKSAEAFQDALFSWPFTWLILHHHFPRSRFVLTTRDSESWYKSITRFHGKRFSNDKTRPPNKKELKNATYRYRGWLWDNHRAVWKTPENDLYNKKKMIENYEMHNQMVRHFFTGKPNFIEIDVSHDDSYIKLCRFLKREPRYEKFPHLNSSK